MTATKKLTPGEKVVAIFLTSSIANLFIANRYIKNNQQLVAFVLLLPSKVAIKMF